LLLGLGWPQWLTIIGLVAGLLFTFKIMARASLAYAKAREERERRALLDRTEDHAVPSGREQNEGEKR
jgi:hypothetical protein